MVKQKLCPQLPMEIWKHISTMRRQTYFVLSQVSKATAASVTSALSIYSKPIVSDAQDGTVMTILNKNDQTHSIKDLPALTTPLFRTWHKNGLKHRSLKYSTIKQKPAEIYTRVLTYVKYGMITRKRTPAIIRGSGDMQRVQNNKVHGIEQPADISNEGSRFWYKNGKLHRVNAPAAIYNDGTVCFYTNDRLTSINDTPAVINNSGRTWACDGKSYRQASNIHKKYAYIIDGTAFWYQSGGISRSEYPAIISHDGSMMWLNNGMTHREHLPASITAGGALCWHENGHIIKKRLQKNKSYIII